MYNKGQSIIELLIVIALAAILLPALLVGFFATRGGRPEQEQRNQAINLLRETQEEVRNIRDANWNTFQLSSGQGVKHPSLSGTSWTLGTGSETVNGITRQVVITDMCRNFTTNALSDPTCTGSFVADPSTKKVVTTITWTNRISNTLSATEYLTRSTNQSYVETTQAQFSAGTKTNVVVTNSAGGEVTLGPGVVYGDWCAPQSGIKASFDIPGVGVPTAVTAATGLAQDVAYATTGDNASGYVTTELAISQTSPPVVTNPHFNNDNGGVKAYGIFTDGTYVYVNEKAGHNHTVQIMDANTNDLGYFDPTSGSAKGDSVYVLGNLGFTTAGSTLYSFDLTSKAALGLHAQKGSIALSGSGVTGNKVIAVTNGAGTTAYVATTNTSAQLQIIPVNANGTFGSITSVNLGNGQGAVDLWVDSTKSYAYVITSFTSGKNDLFVVNLATNAVTAITRHDSLNPAGLYVTDTDKRIIIVGSGGQLYQAYSWSTLPTTAAYCGGVSPNGVPAINAVSGVKQAGGSVFAYVVTASTSAEFQVIQGGPGGSSGTYTATGTYESQTIPIPLLTSPVAFNSFSANYYIPTSPSGANLTFAVAIKNPSGGGNCSTVTFSDSDFTAVSPGPLSLSGISYSNPGQCLRYRTYFTATSDNNQTPILYDATFNYSP